MDTAVIENSRLERAALFRVDARDSVAVALRDLTAGEVLNLHGQTLTCQTDVPRLHKLALRDHAMGEAVIRFGEIIGEASTPIATGEHVHSHNLKTRLRDDLCYRYDPKPRPAPAGRADGLTFMGYRRADGRVGTRNEIWLIPTVGCVANLCETVARRTQNLVGANLEAIVALPHAFGCSQLGDDLAATRGLLAGLIGNPNAAGVVLVGLGCENNQAAELLATLDEGDRAKVINVIAQTSADEVQACLDAVATLAQDARQVQRTVCPVSDLVIGLKCGGSDAMSGLTANPALGRMTDAIVAAGGSTILSEIPEIFGAEHLLMQRADSRQVFDDLVAAVDGFKAYFRAHGQAVHENPSPGNKAGGITTLEEKSLGAVQKAGQATLMDVIAYAGRIRRPGLTLLQAPGNDAVSSTALAAAGATLILFTTGRGTPLGFPVPTVKIASNSDLATRKPGWIDFDAGPLIEADDTSDLDAALLRLLLEIASGKPTRNEINGERSIAIWKTGVTL